MPLADDIQAIRDRALFELDASHDYYAHSKNVWRLLQRDVMKGRTFTFRNLATRTQVDQQVLLSRTQLYVTNYLMSFTFQQFVSLFEVFFFDLLRRWLAAYPHSLSKKEVRFRDILDAPDDNTKESIVLAVVDRRLNELKFSTVADWFKYLEELAQLGCPTVDEIERLAEIKASRDILVHNNGVANRTYIAKAGSRARCEVGTRLELPGRYHRESWETIRDMVRGVADAAASKAAQRGR